MISTQDYSRRKNLKSEGEKSLIFTGGKRKADVSSLNHSRIEDDNEIGAKAPKNVKSGSSGPGIWHGKGMTKTVQSSTLFVTNIPLSVPFPSVAALFKEEIGFVAFRVVRRMAFVDFDTVASSSLSMRKYQNHRFPGVDSVRGLLIDYDKDSPLKRAKEFDDQLIRDYITKEDSELVTLNCNQCDLSVINLRILPPKTYSTLPVRSIDGSKVINTKNYLISHRLKRGKKYGLNRENGIEVRVELDCHNCQQLIGYCDGSNDKSDCKRVSEEDNNKEDEEEDNIKPNDNKVSTADLSEQSIRLIERGEMDEKVKFIFIQESTVNVITWKNKNERKN